MTEKKEKTASYTLTGLRDFLNKEFKGRKVNGKDWIQVYKERQVAKPVKTKRYVYKPKATGEREMFLEIWEEREHFCTNCGVYLGEVPHAFMFAHVEAKSLNGGKKRLEKANVKLSFQVPSTKCILPP